jgi:hypothetical protein
LLEFWFDNANPQKSQFSVVLTGLAAVFTPMFNASFSFLIWIFLLTDESEN